MNWRPRYWLGRLGSKAETATKVWLSSWRVRIRFFARFGNFAFLLEVDGRDKGVVVGACDRPKLARRNTTIHGHGDGQSGAVQVIAGPNRSAVTNSPDTGAARILVDLVVDEARRDSGVGHPPLGARVVCAIAEVNRNPAGTSGASDDNFTSLVVGTSRIRVHRIKSGERDSGRPDGTTWND